MGVAHFQVTTNAELDIPFIPGFSLNGNLFYAERQYADLANNQRIPSYTRVDLGMRYVAQIQDRTVTFRATVNNVADRNYYQGVGGGSLILGVPRTVLASVSVDF